MENENVERVVAEKEPTSQNLSPREQFREKNADALKGEGNPDEKVTTSSEPVADVKKPDPVVKDAGSDVEGKGYKRRVDALTRGRTEAEARASRAEAKFAELEARLNAMQNPKPAKNEIDPSHYIDNAEYIKALAADQAKQAANEVFSERQKTDLERLNTERKQAEEAEQFYNRVDKTYGSDATKIAEFQGLVNENVDLLNRLPADIHDFVDDSPLGVRVLETILKYPQFQDLLMGLKNPAYRLIKLTEIERALSTSSTSQAKQVASVSNAPDPVGSVGTGGSSVVNPDDISFRERLLLRQKQRLNR